MKHAAKSVALLSAAFALVSGVGLAGELKTVTIEYETESQRLADQKEAVAKIGGYRLMNVAVEITRLNVTKGKSQRAELANEAGRKAVLDVIASKLSAALNDYTRIRTTDTVWRNDPAAAMRLSKAVIDDNSSLHGYGQLTLDPACNVEADATLLLSLAIDYDRDEEGRPCSVKAIGKLDIRDREWNSIFRTPEDVTIPDVMLSAEGNDSFGRPDELAFLSNDLFTDAVVKGAIEIFAPSFVQVAWKIDQSGDKSSLFLLNAGAFVDAIEWLEKIPAELRNFADFRNLGIAYEAVKEKELALAMYKKAKELDVMHESLEIDEFITRLERELYGAGDDGADEEADED